MDTARIREAAADAGGRVLATVSNDKTVRGWSLSIGELLRVLRPPIGKGPEGDLFAARDRALRRYLDNRGVGGVGGVGDPLRVAFDSCARHALSRKNYRGHPPAIQPDSCGVSTSSRAASLRLQTNGCADL
jgi:hypothetical protein